MKTFFKIDSIVQQSVFLIFIAYLIFNYFIIKHLEKIFYFYYFVGGFQLVSFLIRLFLKYKKSTFFKVYGYLIVPVWTILFSMILLQGKNIDLGEFNKIAGLFFLLLYAAFFYSPILSIFYILDIKKVYKNYEKSNV
ncbi:hypothetical protein [Halpernia frigidisoli]|uniref:Uncharacterized protein n=1 Tax=Halpernia frigidisoli TaxID=1125876 RepID=A0A1I3DX97_9FLAO|nr:hypothetical protein [Halpernia frigidisoli]SFH91315.1 hypothetical protein SAMN05443292_0754 [Halpernia frigidisoli]